ncbi:MAG: hypothetical protein AB1644_08175 [Candidatus Zixiibacteriota bacterium]
MGNKTRAFAFVAGALSITLGILATPGPLSAASETSYPCRLGDNINYYNGELTIDHVDVTLPGRRGLDVVIARHYSTSIYRDSAYTDAGQYSDYVKLSNPDRFAYLGQGWTIGYPYLIHDDRRNPVYHRFTDFLVHGDGSRESFIKNLDSLTNTDYRKKTRSLALFTGHGPSSSLPDTLLLTDGTKWIFDHIVGQRKLLTKIANRFGDTLRVQYLGTTAWIDRVISPIGLEVLFRYGTVSGSTVLPVGTPPPDTTYRLRQLNYLSASGDTIRVRYGFYPAGSKSCNLRSVTFASGDQESFDYSKAYFYQT